MDLLIVAATQKEIAPFIETNPKTSIFLTGVGVPATIFNLSKKLASEKFDLVIQAGIAGTFAEKFDSKNAVVVDKDTFADIGADDHGTFKTLFEMGLVDENEFPYQSGWLTNDTQLLTDIKLTNVSGITVNKIIEDHSQIKKLTDKFQPDIESMEGAAFHYVCLMNKVQFLQLRTISNVVGERDKSKWKMKEAIATLNNELQILITKFSSL